MRGKKIVTILLAVFCARSGMAQFCPPLGQTPKGAYPICGNITINQQPNPVCVSPEVNVPTCSYPMHYIPYYPFWYKFTCYQSGNFGFLITPNEIGRDDYDWQLYDVTGQYLMALYNSNTIPIAGNWVATTGPTGAQPGGSKSPFQCIDSRPSSPMTKMIHVTVGHTYLLLVSHRLYPPPETYGYKLEFKNGNADIHDTLQPHLLAASTPCAGTPLTVKFNKKLRCSSVALDGSQFVISPPNGHVVQAGLFGCDETYELDSVVLVLDNPLLAGTYTVSVKPDNAGNELKDFCDNTIPANETVSFVVAPLKPKMDSITKPGCNPDEIEVVFSKKITCASVAANGSDFVVTGTSPVTVVGAQAYHCLADPFSNFYSNAVRIKFSAPISGKGNYQIKLKQGTDGNTVLDICGAQVAVGATLAFSTSDTVNANFTYNIHPGCKTDTINYFHPAANDVNEWKWDFDGIATSNLQNPQMFYNSFGIKNTQLTVSNGGCSATSTATIKLDDRLKAGFEATNAICPGDPAMFKDTSAGNIVSWLWNFGNGVTSISRSPAKQFYLMHGSTYTVTPQLTVKNSIGCTSTATQKITVLDKCYIMVPGAFTPNRDGLNDYLFPLNGYKASSLYFIVYNRYGQIMFETKDSSERWDGRFKGQPADAGTYIWILHYTDSYTKEYVEQKGTTILIR